MTLEEQIADEEAGKVSYRSIALELQHVTAQFKALRMSARARTRGREAESLSVVISHIEAARAELLRLAK